ncbi:MAG: 3-dehydroquinate dehydratase [Bacteroidales bacterium]|nr:3-dehydroquinate dehydratase [Bacteroidales bacterium]
MRNEKEHIRLLIVNGVNLSCLGTREVNIYGNVSFGEYLETLRGRYPQVELDYFQSDHVGEIAEKITSARNLHGIVLNAGAYTHTSVVLADAVRTAQCPVVEVHISNLFGREQYRRNSVLSSVCAGFISGFGLDGYELAVLSFLRKNDQEIKLYRV